MIQLAFSTILEQSFRARQRAIDRYCAANVDRYTAMAEFIRPDLHDDHAIYARVAFAILSANAPFKHAQAALGYVLNRPQGHVNEGSLMRFGIIPARAAYLNALPVMSTLLRTPAESWHAYRMRLRHDVRGLGLAKASFAACLLYPTTADLACVDTHMQKVYFGHTKFHDLSVVDYLACERKVRAVAEKFSVGTFIAQWMIWDHVRGKIETHAIFPGAHKDVVASEPWREW